LIIAELDYELPSEAIAQEPLPQRDASRLMLLPRRAGLPQHHRFRDLPDLLCPGDLLVINRSRVIPARLHARRATGGRVEVLLLRDRGADTWEAFLRPAARLRPGELLTVDDDLTVVVEEGTPGPDGRRVVGLRTRAGDLATALARCGRVPLPPYIRRAPRPDDRDRYQTVYAREQGSVAAPTAGLHFTPELLERLQKSGVGIAELVLHVGPGTFQPVTAEVVEDHRVAPEPFEVPWETAAEVTAVRRRGGRVIAVGTTTVRALETVARGDGTLSAGTGETDLVVRPGHVFQVVQGLVTNFHLPRSSLLLLVAAFAGRERVLAAYADALRSGYRFYSYGDAMLIV
jgi:S-adenosylmethionine:tRNA ribosyltransferase-isomerase